MELKNVHELVALHYNKQQGGYLQPQVIDLALDEAQLEEFRFLFGDERRSTGVAGQGSTYKISATLEPFKTKYTFNSQDYNNSTNPEGTGPTGIIVLPMDYYYISPDILINSKFRCKLVSEDELGERLNSSIRMPTFSYPLAVIGSKKVVNQFDVSKYRRIQLFPEKGFDGYLFYYRRPIAPQFVGTVSGRTLVYDPVKSVQLEWDDIATMRIIERAVAILGEYSRELDINNINTQKNNQ